MQDARHHDQPHELTTSSVQLLMAVNLTPTPAVHLLYAYDGGDKSQWGGLHSRICT